MRTALLLALTFTAVSTLPAAEANRFDVVVYGGTPGGIGAAIAAARHSARVVMLEPTRHVGGLSTSGLVNDEMVHMHPWSITGISREFFLRLSQPYGKTDFAHRWESKVAEKLFNEMLAEARVAVRFGQRVAQVSKQGPRIEAIVLTDGSRLTGSVFIDASYEGDLMARAGVRYTWGRESQDEFKEPLAGVRLIDQAIRARTRDAEGRLLPGISAQASDMRNGQSDRKVMNYNFRLCFTQKADNQAPFPKPKNYDPARYQILANFLAEHPKTKLLELIDLYKSPNGKFEVNNKQNAVISIGHFGGQFDYPDADYARQDAIYQDHVDYTQGFFWYLCNEPTVPEALRRETRSWGLAKDEFVDNGNWPYYLYIREARRMRGRYVMSQKDIQDDRRKPDSICLGSHYIDSHHVERVAVDAEHFTNEGRLWVPGVVYEIPYRAITPEASQAENLVVPVAASFTHVAFCTFRLEPTWLGAGHAAGVAAAKAAASGRAVQDLDVADLQAQLRRDGQLLSLDDEPKDADAKKK